MGLDGMTGLFNSNQGRSANGTAPPTIAAVIVTRNRTEMLRQTIVAVKQSATPVQEIIVSDDSTGNETARMLTAEFPDVIRVEGPKRGISANRNRGMGIARSDYILLSDDDMLVDPNFLGGALDLVREKHASLVFTATSDDGNLIYPNTFDFLGYSRKPYKPGTPYNTANQQCFLISRELAWKEPYDETITSYGYEEMDFAYRIAATGAIIDCVPGCKNIHLAPNANQPYRPEKEACRLYVTFKRIAYIDRQPLKALAFVLVAVPHHFLGSVRREGLAGIGHAWKHIHMALRMLLRFRAHGLRQPLSAVQI